MYKIQVPAHLLLGEGPLSGLQRAAFSLCAHVTKGENGVSSSSYKDTDPLMGTPTS